MPKPVKAIILAAGIGFRLRPLTDDRPKCMVEIDGRTLLDRQIATFRDCGVTDLLVVAGHAEGHIDRKGVGKIINERFATTNMVASLFRAESVMDGSCDIVVSYGDIVYERRVLRELLKSGHGVSICVDRLWRDYWTARMEDPLSDAETLKIGCDGRIKELGRKPEDYTEIDGQYIGLFKFRADQLAAIRKVFHGLDRNATYEGKSIDQMYMTCFIQLLIDRGFDVRPVLIEHGWLEVDSLNDLTLYRVLLEGGDLARFYDDKR